MNVMVVDDTRLMRDGIANLLRAQGHKVVAQAANGRDAIAQASTARPDLVLMDIRMDVTNGLEATRIIKTKHPDMKIVILTVSDDEEDLLEAVRSGADGYLLKDMTAEQLFEELDTVARGGAAISKSLAGKLLEEFRRQSKGPGAGRSNAALSARELEVLELVAQGHSNRAIGEHLIVSENTIKYHMKRILDKLHLENRAQVVAWAERHFKRQGAFALS